MDIRLRLVPLVALIGLVITHILAPDFLGQRIHSALPITWYWAVIVPLSYLAAYTLTPPFMRMLNRLAKVAFLPVAFFLIVVVGLLWFADLSWNHLVDPWCSPCGESHILPSFTAAVFGSS